MLSGAAAGQENGANAAGDLGAGGAEGGAGSAGGAAGTGGGAGGDGGAAGFGAAAGAGAADSPSFVPFNPSSSRIREMVSSFVRAGCPIGNGFTPAACAAAFNLKAGNSSSSAFRAVTVLPEVGVVAAAALGALGEAGAEEAGGLSAFESSPIS